MKPITVKYVKRARMWCKTTKLEGDAKKHKRFKQEWYDNKPNE